MAQHTNGEPLAKVVLAYNRRTAERDAPPYVDLSVSDGVSDDTHGYRACVGCSTENKASYSPRQA